MIEFLFGLPAILFIIYTIIILKDDFFEERKMRNKGYRHMGSPYSGPTWWEPDPMKKGVIPDEKWKARGYRWSEKYHRWYKPQKHT